jgi:serine/threonine-protein kinase
VPDYEILAEIGRGGMGVVYKARHIALNRVVALKMVLHGEYASPEARRRFRSEAEAVARIQHPHIVQIFDIGEQDGRLYFALEYCSAGSLAVKLNGKSQPPREAAGLVALLARAVHAIHQQQIVHRDLKPANVLFAADGQPKITDFGLARRLDEHTQTQTGAVIGTPNYMAPEQARGDTKQVGPAVDIYALGAILYECLTGRRLFLASNALATLADVLEKAPTSPRSLNRSVGRDLETICLKCLEKDPAKRYASAEDLAEDLERYIRGEPVRARRVSRLGRGMRWARRRPALALCLVLLFVAILAAVSLWKWGDDHRKAAAKAVREREEIQRFVEGLSPQQKEVMREFSAWIKERPHLANMRFEDAFARYKQENPGVVEVFQTAPPEVSAADVVSYPMIGD